MARPPYRSLIKKFVVDCTRITVLLTRLTLAVSVQVGRRNKTGVLRADANVRLQWA